MAATNLSYSSSVTSSISNRSNGSRSEGSGLLLGEAECPESGAAGPSWSRPAASLTCSTYRSTGLVEGSYDRDVAINEWVVPDFETLYGDRPLSARMAARLWYVADSTYGSYFDGMADAWIADLPRIAQIHADEAFAAAFGERFGILANRIAAGLAELTDLTTCTADEAALHLVIDRAEELLGRAVSTVTGWPRSPIVQPTTTSAASRTTCSTTSTSFTSTTLQPTAPKILSRTSPR